jgi:tRNA (guanine37-N1)-methyltransferase
LRLLAALLTFAAVGLPAGPEAYEGRQVPPVLLSGDHAAIARWRLKQALGRTWLRRRELLHGVTLDAQRAALLQEFLQEREQEQEGET